MGDKCILCGMDFRIIGTISKCMCDYSRRIRHSGEEASSQSFQHRGRILWQHSPSTRLMRIHAILRATWIRKRGNGAMIRLLGLIPSDGRSISPSTSRSDGCVSRNDLRESVTKKKKWCSLRKKIRPSPISTT
jgi:hypothetical protein